MPEEPAPVSSAPVISYASAPIPEKLWRRLARLAGAIFFFTGLLLCGIMFFTMATGELTNPDDRTGMITVEIGMMLLGGGLLWVFRRQKEI